MTTYEETIGSLKEMRTIASHITKIGKIMNKTEDEKLRDLLGNLITSLQKAHANPNIKSKSTPGNLYNANSIYVKHVINYCNNFIEEKKPEWQILAERHGWGPKY